MRMLSEAHDEDHGEPQEAFHVMLASSEPTMSEPLLQVEICHINQHSADHVGLDVEAADGARLWELPPQALVQLAHGRLAHAVGNAARKGLLPVHGA